MPASARQKKPAPWRPSPKPTYSCLPKPDVAEFHDILGKAYIAEHGSNTGFDDRIENRAPRIFDVVRSHPEWFGVPG